MAELQTRPGSGGYCVTLVYPIPLLPSGPGGVFRLQLHSPPKPDRSGCPLKRREWDSNPRWSYPHTRFPSVLLKPLGHLSEGLLHCQANLPTLPHSVSYAAFQSHDPALVRRVLATSEFDPGLITKTCRLQADLHQIASRSVRSGYSFELLQRFRAVELAHPYQISPDKMMKADRRLDQALVEKASGPRSGARGPPMLHGPRNNARS